MNFSRIEPSKKRQGNSNGKKYIYDPVVIAEAVVTSVAVPYQCFESKRKNFDRTKSWEQLISLRQCTALFV